jgi:hypothetical protein
MSDWATGKTHVFAMIMPFYGVFAIIVQLKIHVKKLEINP